jgi:hypothetical protein
MSFQEGGPHEPMRQAGSWGRHHLTPCVRTEPICIKRCNEMIDYLKNSLDDTSS